MFASLLVCVPILAQGYAAEGSLSTTRGIVSDSKVMLNTALTTIQLSNLRMSSDGLAAIYRTREVDMDQDVWKSRTWRVPLEGGAPTAIEANGREEAFAESKKEPEVSRALSRLNLVVKSWSWGLDRQSLLAICFDAQKRELWHVPLKGTATRIDLNDMSVEDAKVTPDGTILAIANDPSHADELYSCSLDGRNPKRLTQINTKAEVGFGRSEMVSWDSEPRYRMVAVGKHEMSKPNFTPGFHPNGVVTYPSGYTTSKTYPLVVLAEPGISPSASLDYNPFRNSLADLGYIVLDVNCRGSNNLGPQFMSDAKSDTGEGQAADLVGGIDLLVKRQIADPSNVLVFGWSSNGKTPKWLPLIRTTRLKTEIGDSQVDRPYALRRLYEQVTEHMASTSGRE